MVELVTGTAGKDHVSSADVGSFNAGIIGEGTYILPRGKRMQCEKVSDNLVKVLDGDMLFKGRHIRIEPEDYEELTIVNGASGTKRHDLICIRIEKNENTQVETASFVVVQGEFADSPTDPQYTKGTILEGDYTVDEYPICRVVLNGLQIESVTMLVEVAKSISELEKEVEGLASTKANASDVSSAFSSVNNAISGLDKSKAEQTDLNALQTQVNNLVKTDKETEGNAELIDVRLGEDGETYETAGEAVRTQIKNVKKQIDAHTVITTDTTLSNSKASALKINAIRGNSEQKSYSGKNKLNCEKQTESTSGGITFTPVYDDVGKLLYYQASGTSTGNYSASYKSVLSISLGNYNLTEGESYTFSANSTDDNLRIYGLYKTSADSSYKNLFAPTNTETTATIPSDILDIQIRLVCYSSGATLSNAKIYPMIRLATVTDSTYEPYVGGMNSPNPQYDQKINSSGDSGSITVKGHGKNFLNLESMNFTTSYVTPTVENGCVKLVTKSDSYPQQIYGRLPSVDGLAGKTITVSYDNFATSDSSVQPLIYINEYGADGTGKEYIFGGSYGNSKTFTTLENLVRMRFLARVKQGSAAASGVTVTFEGLQLEISPTKTDYEPYTESTFEIPLSEPLCALTDDIYNYITPSDIHKKLGIRVYDGVNVKFDGKSGTTKNNLFYNDLDGAVLVANNINQPIKCSHMAHHSFGNLYGNDLIGVSNYINSSRLYTGFGLDSELTTVDLANAWLAEQYNNGTPFTVIYQLAEEVVEPLDSKTQALFYQLESYEGVTYITTDSTVQPTIEVEYAVTDAGAHMLNNYAKSNLAELKAKKSLPENSTTRSTAVTVEGLKSVDAVELNPSVEGTLANKVAKCGVVPQFTYISDTANVVLSVTGYWDVSAFAVYQEEYTYDSYYRRHTLLEMTISRATAAAGSQLLFSVNGITYDTTSQTPLLISVVDANGNAQQAYGTLGTRWGDFDINFVDEPTTGLDMYLRIEFTQYQKI